MTASGTGTRLFGRLNVSRWRDGVLLRGSAAATDLAGTLTPTGYNDHSSTEAEILHLDRLAVLEDRQVVEGRR